MNKELFLHLTCFIKESNPSKEDYLLQKEIQIAKQKYRDSIKEKYFCCYKADLFLVKEILKKRGMYE